MLKQTASSQAEIMEGKVYKVLEKGDPLDYKDNASLEGETHVVKYQTSDSKTVK